MKGVNNLEVAGVGADGTPLGLESDGLDTPLNEPVPEVVETREGGGAVQRSGLSSGPENFSRRGGTRPGHGVEV